MSEKKVLFSPVGGADPIDNYRDGSLLHICRIYKPDIVYLYLSKEILAFHNDDNRYVYCLEKLSELIGHKFEYEFIERPELENVYDFDFFYEEFEKCIRDIRKKHNGEILLNISSGTPAMKNALNTLPILLDIKLTAIQVVTPEGKMNVRTENKGSYDKEEQWEFNEDNVERSFKDRTLTPKNRNQIAIFTINNIKRHIDAYDYIAALHLAETIQEFVSQDCVRLLKIACARLKLDFSEFRRLDGIREKLLPVESGDIRNLVEYILALQIKVKREEYADFLRAVSPIFFELEKRMVEEQLGIDLGSITEDDRKGIRKWKKDLKTINPHVYSVLDKAYNNGFKGGLVQTDHLTFLISDYGHKETEIKQFENFRTIESSVRNVAAHNIVAVTDGWIKKKCGSSAEEIMKKLKEMAMIVGVGIEKDGWESYGLMNERIKEEL